MKHIIVLILFIFNPFKSFCYYLKNFENIEVDKEELLNEIRMSETLMKFMRIK